jgi:Nucleotide-diphospho-sugar transferase
VTAGNDAGRARISHQASSSSAGLEIGPAALPGYSVVTAVDENYLDIFALWLESFEFSGYLPQLTVITYDARSTKFVERRGLTHIRLADRVRDPRQIFVSRLEVIQDLIGSGAHVINTDADAFWLRPDLPSMTKPAVDLQISVGHGIPRRAIEEWGFSLCCGFFILHSTARTRSFLPTWLQRTRDMNDDQRALNDLLLEHEIQWTAAESHGRIGYSRSFDLHVEAISPDVISRVTPTGVQIYHPYLSGRYQQVKMLQLARKLAPSRRIALRRQARIVLDVRGWQGTFRHLANKALVRIRP